MIRNSIQFDQINKCNKKRGGVQTHFVATERSQFRDINLEYLNSRSLRLDEIIVATRLNRL